MRHSNIFSLMILLFSISMLFFQFSYKNEAHEQAQVPCCSDKHIIDVNQASYKVEQVPAETGIATQMGQPVTLPAGTTVTTQMGHMMFSTGNKTGIIMPGGYRPPVHWKNRDGLSLTRTVFAEGDNKWMLLGGAVVW